MSSVVPAPAPVSTPDAGEIRDRLAGARPLLPVVAATAEGVWVADVEGRRYLDLSSSSGALTFGHRHPALLAVATEQLARATFASRALGNDRSGGFAAALAELAGVEVALPVSTADEALDIAVAAALAAAGRRAGHDGRADAASVVVATGSHDRLVAAGARTVAFGDAAALVAALGDDVAAVVLEPVQVEAGVVAPAADYLGAVRAACAERGVVFVLDETRSGLGRTGDTLAPLVGAEAPDLRLLGPALGGGIVPSAAVLGSREMLGAVGAAASGSLLAAAIGHRVVELLGTGEIQTRARALAEHLAARVEALVGAGATAARTAGVWAGIDIDPGAGSAADLARRLVARGVLVDVAGESTIVLSPPLVIRATELDWAVEQVRVVLAA
ncbi:MAG: aminotransferase class III-fold pyridoxal phosphate-dependent enzyme [Microbacterium arborescens]